MGNSAICSQHPAETCVKKAVLCCPRAGEQGKDPSVGTGLAHSLAPASDDGCSPCPARGLEVMTAPPAAAQSTRFTWLPAALLGEDFSGASFSRFSLFSPLSLFFLVFCLWRLGFLTQLTLLFWVSVNHKTGKHDRIFGKLTLELVRVYSVPIF